MPLKNYFLPFLFFFPSITIWNYWFRDAILVLMLCATFTTLLNTTLVVLLLPKKIPPHIWLQMHGMIQRNLKRNKIKCSENDIYLQIVVTKLYGIVCYFNYLKKKKKKKLKRCIFTGFYRAVVWVRLLSSKKLTVECN